MQLVVFAIAALAVISRRPDAVTNPQFFAEDGMFWYADAYNLGWLRALFLPHTGYFQTLPRLTAALCLLIPLQFAPLLMNLVAVVIQVLPVTLLASIRCSHWGSLNFRLFLAAAYIALPNSRELDAAITEAQWHMALLAALVILSLPSARTAWRVFDILVLLLSGLTGPFCLVLLPAAGAIWWKRRRTWSLVLASLLACCAALQLFALSTTVVATRSQAPLGATPALFFRMLVGDVYLGAILGQNPYAAQWSAARLTLVGFAATALIVYCLMKAIPEIKIFLLYCLALYAASLANPMISLDKPQWAVLEGAPGLRYWFFPMLAFVWSAVWCVALARPKMLRLLALGMLALSLAGIARDWRYPAYSDHDFPAYAHRFETSPPGSMLIFPLYPDGWTMQLTKKGGSCSTLPLGFIDQPPNKAHVSGSVAVSGWVNAQEPVEAVKIYLDEQLKQTLAPDVPRPDVDQIYPGGPVKEKGWHTRLDLSKANPGVHRIEVHALLSGGCDAVIGTAIVETGRTF